MAERYSGVLDPANGTGNDDGSEPAVIDPNTVNRGSNGTGSADSGGNDIGSSSGRKRRSDAGTKRGPRGSSRASTSKATLDIDGVSALLVLIHKALAEYGGVRDESGILIYELSDTEGKALAVAANNVIRHYDIAATQKMMDWGAAMTTVLAVYAPKLRDHVEARERSIPNAVANRAA